MHVDKDGLFEDLVWMLVDCMDEAAKRLANDLSDESKDLFYERLAERLTRRTHRREVMVGKMDETKIQDRFAGMRDLVSGDVIDGTR